MDPNTNLKAITSSEWWTLAIGVVAVVVIIILMLYTGSKEPTTSTASAGATSGNSTTSASVVASSAAANPSSSSATVAEAGDTVTVNYTGMLADGTVFDSSASHGQPFSFTLGAGQVIPGWDKGIVGMTVGQTKTLTIPPADAYGAKGVQDPNTGKYIIPPNATLTFQVTVVSIEAPSSSTSAQ